MRAISLLPFAASALAVIDVSDIKANYFFKGQDLSSLRLFELQGVDFKDTAMGNETRDAEDIFGDGGMNTVRLRVRLPMQQYTASMLTRVKAVGRSDRWRSIWNSTRVLWHQLYASSRQTHV